MSTLKEFSNSLIFPLGDKLPEQFSKFFIGQVHLNMLTTTGVSIGNVTFEPACRNNWHIHHKGGQMLLVTAGEGYYQEWGKPAQKLKAGDTAIVYLPGHYGTIVDYNAKKDKYLLMDPHYLPKRGTSSFGDWVSQKDLEEGALTTQMFFYYKAN